MSQCRVYSMSSRIALFAAVLALFVHQAVSTAIQANVAADGSVVDQTWAAQVTADAQRIAKMEEEDKQAVLAEMKENHARLRGAARKTGVFADDSEKSLNTARFKELCASFVETQQAAKVDLAKEKKHARAALHALGLPNGTPQMKAVLSLVEQGALNKDASVFCAAALAQLQAADLEGADMAADSTGSGDAESQGEASHVEVSSRVELKAVQEHQAGQVASSAAASVAVDSKGGVVNHSSTATTDAALEQQQQQGEKDSSKASYVIGVDGSVQAR